MSRLLLRMRVSSIHPFFAQDFGTEELDAISELLRSVHSIPCNFRIFDQPNLHTYESLSASPPILPLPRLASSISLSLIESGGACCILHPRPPRAPASHGRQAEAIAFGAALRVQEDR